MTNRTPLHDVLTQERIDTMRSTVLSEIERPESRTTQRRLPVWLLTSAAVAALVLGFGFLAAVLDQGAGRTDFSIAEPAEETGWVATPTQGDGSEDTADSDSSGAGEIAPGAQSDPSPRGAIGDSAEASESMITTGTVRLTASEPVAASSELADFVVANQGRVDARRESGNGTTSRVELTVRLPPDRVEAFTQRAHEIAEVEEVAVNNDNVTDRVRDLETRIDSLRVSITRLEDLIAEADTTEDLLRIEELLSSRQFELESLLAEQRNLNNSVTLATLSISINAHPQASSFQPNGFAHGVLTSWNALVGTVNTLVTAFGFALVWVVPVGIIVGSAWLFRWLFRRPRQHTQPAEGSEPTSDS